MNAGLSSIAAKASRKIDKSADEVEDTVAEEGAGPSAGLGGLRALLTGKSPAWAALKGAWSGASIKSKTVAILALILLLVLAPVLLVVLLLVLIVVGVITAIRAAAR